MSESTKIEDAQQDDDECVTLEVGHLCELMAESIVEHYEEGRDALRQRAKDCIYHAITGILRATKCAS